MLCTLAPLRMLSRMLPLQIRKAIVRSPTHASPFALLPSSMSAIALKNNIRRLRFERNMTQEELALRVAVSRQTIMSIERGRTNPSILLAYKISTALGVDVTAVFQMEGKLAPV